MDRVLVLVLVALLCLAHSTPMQQPVVERSSRRPPPEQRHQHQSTGNTEGGGQEYYNGRGSAENIRDKDGARRRRLTTTATNLAANRQHQFAGEAQAQRQQTKGEATATTKAAAGAAESRSAAATRAGRSDTTMSRSVGGVPGSEAALKGAAGPEARVHVVQTDIVEGEGQAVESDGVVQAVEVEQAEEDKGIEEGQAGGFVVFAPDGKPEEGEAGDSVDNDNSSTNGISDNIMVIVFCALAFVANGGFLVYVFWVM